MSELIRCKTCAGRKRVELMGGMWGKCENCTGLGWIEDKKITKTKTPNISEEKEVSRETFQETSDNIVKRRGRPAKIA